MTSVISGINNGVFISCTTADSYSVKSYLVENTQSVVSQFLNLYDITASFQLQTAPETPVIDKVFHLGTVYIHIRV